MSLNDRRIVVAALTGVCVTVLLVAVLLLLDTVGYIRWSHFLVTVGTAAVLTLAGLAYLYRTRGRS